MLPLCNCCQFQCCRNRPLRGFATRGEANTPNEVSAEFPIGHWHWLLARFSHWQHLQTPAASAESRGCSNRCRRYSAGSARSRRAAPPRGSRRRAAVSRDAPRRPCGVGTPRRGEVKCCQCYQCCQFQFSISNWQQWHCQLATFPHWQHSRCLQAPGRRRAK